MPSFLTDIPFNAGRKFVPIISHSTPPLVRHPGFVRPPERQGSAQRYLRLCRSQSSSFISLNNLATVIHLSLSYIWVFVLREALRSRLIAILDPLLFVISVTKGNPAASHPSDICFTQSSSSLSTRASSGSRTVSSTDRSRALRWLMAHIGYGVGDSQSIRL